MALDFPKLSCGANTFSQLCHLISDPDFYDSDDKLARDRDPAHVFLR